MTLAMDMWQARLLAVGLQGSLLLALALAIVKLHRGLSPLTRVWILRIALAKLILSFVCPFDILSIRLPLSPATTASGPGAVDLLLLASLGLWVVSLVKGLVDDRRKSAELDHWIGRGRPEPSLDRVAHEIALTIGLRNVPPVWIHDELNSPVLIGQRGSTNLLVPAEMPLADPLGLRAGLAHELSHVKHRDLDWAWLTIWCERLLFFHPLVSFALRELRLAEECAADLTATRALHLPAADYSRILLRVATPDVFHGIAMGGAARDLHRRIESIHSGHRRRSGFALVALALVVLAGLPWGFSTRAEPGSTTKASEFRAAL